MYPSTFLRSPRILDHFHYNAKTHRNNPSSKLIASTAVATPESYAFSQRREGGGGGEGGEGRGRAKGGKGERGRGKGQRAKGGKGKRGRGRGEGRKKGGTAAEAG